LGTGTAGGSKWRGAVAGQIDKYGLYLTDEVFLFRVAGYAMGEMVDRGLLPVGRRTRAGNRAA
jgi:hypothetical protein